MGAFFTKLRYVGDEDRVQSGPWDVTIVEIATGDQMVRETETLPEAIAQRDRMIAAFG